MAVKKPKVVIIGAGMAGLTAAHKLYTTETSRDLFDLSVVEGGTRIGGRIHTSGFCGDRIEMGATWIHGINGSPIHKIAQETNSLQDDQPWECMGGFSDEKMSLPTTIAEGGLVPNPILINSISSFFNNLMRTAQGRDEEDEDDEEQGCPRGSSGVTGAQGKQLSLGRFLRQGLEDYWESVKGRNEQEEIKESCDSCGGGSRWSRRELEEAIFAMHENIQRTYTGAGDLFNLDYSAEKEYKMFPGEEITIPRGYMSIIESLASALPAGLIQLGKRVLKIEWIEHNQWLRSDDQVGGDQRFRPVKLHFSDGSAMEADHVILTVSLGVLKAGVREGSGLFSPPLPGFKREAIEKLGYGVVNKLFLEICPEPEQEGKNSKNNYSHINGNKKKMGLFPFIQTLFHRPDSKFRHKKIPWWMRRTASLYPIYANSRVILSWFAGNEALELESLDDKAIIDGVSATALSFLSRCEYREEEMEEGNHHCYCNGNLYSHSVSGFKFTRVVKTKWGSDPLFLGSYSYVAVGSSGDDLDTMAVPLPSAGAGADADADAGADGSPPLQILFAGEATHRTHYSTTHGAYFSGLREANRLLKHYELNMGLYN